MGPLPPFFLDVTDTEFVGNGPELAKKGRTKSNTIRRKINIALLCNERGLPLRWQVFAGNQDEAGVMLDQIRTVGRRPWARNVPIVVDRALGRTKYLRQLMQTRAHFITALTRHEIPSYRVELPDIPEPQGTGRDALKHLANTITNAGFRRVDDSLFVRELGIISKNTTRTSSPPQDVNNRCAVALRQALEMIDLVQSGEFGSYRTAAAQLGLSKGLATKYRKLCRLEGAIQSQVLSGSAQGVAIDRLLNIAKLPADEQKQAFEDLLKLRDQGKLPKPRRTQTTAPKPKTDHDPVTLRGVVYFNPQLLADQRATAQRRLDHLQSFVARLNIELQNPRSRRKKADVLRLIERELRNRRLWDLHDVSVEVSQHDDRSCLQAKLHRIETKWRKKRRLDGFSVIVTRPESTLDAVDLCRRYRCKETVEHDFRTIKSQIGLRPIWHHNESKVKAHVSICMLALLLERDLDHALNGTSSATMALEELSTCCLNLYPTSEDTEPAYLITTPDERQAKILDTLKMQYLTDELRLTESLHPR
jgi:transposase